ncbi:MULTISPECIES: hypothetical protein [Pseudomonadaceae]|jgi:hypothetical protein|nr:MULTISPECIES: hypothetical protein [Pseudomonas]
MSQTAFGILMLTFLLFVCSGMAIWVTWPNFKLKAQKLLRSH